MKKGILPLAALWLFTSLSYGQAAAPATDVVVCPVSEDTEIDFVGYKIGGSKEGSFLLYGGEFHLKGNNIADSSFEGYVEMDSVLTHYDGLTKNLKSANFFDAKTYPKGSFKSTEIKKSADGYDIVGDLTLKDKPIRLTIPAKISDSGGQITISSKFEIDRQKWGMTYKGLGEHIMKDNIDVTWSLVFDKPGK